MLDENQVIEEIEVVEEEHFDTSDSLGVDLSVYENNSQDVISQEIINNLNSTDVVDYSEQLTNIEEKLDTIIFLNEQSVFYQNSISSDLSTILVFFYFLIIYFIYKIFSKLLDSLLFKIL